MTTFLIPGDLISFYVTSVIVIVRTACVPEQRAPSSGDSTLRLCIGPDRSVKLFASQSATNNPVTRP